MARLPLGDEADKGWRDGGPAEVDGEAEADRGPAEADGEAEADGDPLQWHVDDVGGAGGLVAVAVSSGRLALVKPSSGDRDDACSPRTEVTRVDSLQPHDDDDDDEEVEEEAAQPHEDDLTVVGAVVGTVVGAAQPHDDVLAVVVVAAQPHDGDLVVMPVAVAVAVAAVVAVVVAVAVAVAVTQPHDEDLEVYRRDDSDVRALQQAHGADVPEEVFDVTILSNPFWCVCVCTS